MNQQPDAELTITTMVRWTCARHDPPVLLAMVDQQGHVHIKVRNRTWYVTDFGEITATCPRCGAEHTLPARQNNDRPRAPESQRQEARGDSHEPTHLEGTTSTAPRDRPDRSH